MTDPDPKDRLEALEAKLKARRAAERADTAHQEEHYSQANVAWRMVTELVAGLGIGFGIGYGLDTVLGSTPWLMVVFTLLGVAAGIKVMMRSAADIQRAQEARDGDAHVAQSGTQDTAAASATAPHNEEAAASEKDSDGAEAPGDERKDHGD